MSDGDEQLIELVKQYSVLYDMSSGQYRDHTIRNNAWEVIAEQLDTTVEACKERWGKLRNCFTNALKRRDKKRGQAATNIVPWKYEKQMEFLLRHVQGRRTITNLSADINDDSTQESLFSEEPESPRADAIFPTQSTSSVTTPTPSSSNVETLNSSWSSVRRPTPTSSTHRTSNRIRVENDDNTIKELIDVMKSSQESRQKRIADMDETDHFFLAMSKQLKKLPKIDQANIKFQMHKLIHEAEMNVIKKNEQLLKTPISVTRNQIIQPKIDQTKIQMLKLVQKNEQLLKTPISVNRNQIIQYPNISYSKTANNGTPNNIQIYETNTQDVSENVVLHETAQTPNNTVEKEDETQEIENESEVINLKEYFINYNRF